MLGKIEIKRIFTVAVVLFVSVQIFQNVIPFGSEERINFYFSQMAYINAMFAYCFYRLLKSRVTFFWLWYVIGELINEIFFTGGMGYIELIIGFTALLYYLFRYGRKRDKRTIR